MSEFPLIEFVRGPFAETFHAGAISISDTNGRQVFGIGNTDFGTYPRSAAKSLQSLPLLTSGAADRYGLSQRHLALAIASHDGLPMHTRAVNAMLAQMGLEPAHLECGAHAPLSGRKPQIVTDLHNCCSGKHGGFLGVAAHRGIGLRGYVHAEHAIQRGALGSMEIFTGTKLINYGIDGCSIPTYQVPLKNLSAGFARYGTGIGVPTEMGQAAQRFMQAAWAHPEMVQGPGKFDTEIMRAFNGQVFTKFGAMGVYVASLPQKGLGIAIKCFDGSVQAAEVMMANVLGVILKPKGAQAETLARWSAPTSKNWKGIEVGALQPTKAFNLNLNALARIGLAFAPIALATTAFIKLFQHQAQA
jgi:L-asparaginase II